MASAETFHADLEKLNKFIVAQGARIDFGDGSYGIDKDKIPYSVLRAYNNLISYGYANGFL